MNKENKNFENILDECLGRMLLGGETVEQCLQYFPEDADKLKPLLETTFSVSHASAVKPRPEFRERAKYQFIAAAREKEEKKNRSLFSFGWQPRWAMAAISAVLIVLLSGGGTVAAASNSMPDDTLYPVKLASEQTRMAFTFTELGKAELYADMADTRVNEIVYLAGGNDAVNIEQTANLLNSHLVAMAGISSVNKAWSGGESVAGIQEEAVLEMDNIHTLTAPAPSQDIPEAAVSSINNTECFAASTTGEKPEESTETEENAAPEMSAAPDRSVEERDITASSGTGQFVTPQYPGTLGSGDTDKLTVINAYIANQSFSNSARLRAVLETVPESARSALIEAIINLETSYVNAVNSINNP